MFHKVSNSVNLWRNIAPLRYFSTDLQNSKPCGGIFNILDDNNVGVYLNHSHTVDRDIFTGKIFRL